MLLSSYRIFAHRQRIADRSPYFNAMFFGYFLEANEPTVKIQCVEGRALKKLVKFCYTNYIKFKPFDVEEILVAANLLILTDVVDEGFGEKTVTF